MSKLTDQTVVRAWARLLKAHRLALARVEQALKAVGLPDLAWYDVLLELERAGEKGLRPFALERAMLLAQYNLSRLIDRLVDAGLVERQPCPDDRRGQVLVITETGKAMRRRMWPTYSSAIDAAVGRNLSKAQVQGLDTTLGTLIERLQS